MVFFSGRSIRAQQEDSKVWDNYSDTWMATDTLGRNLSTHEQVGPPRPDRFVGIFYFLWHGAHVKGGPFDVGRILAIDPGAMQEKDSPLWGPMHAPTTGASPYSVTTFPTMSGFCVSTPRCWLMPVLIR